MPFVPVPRRNPERVAISRISERKSRYPLPLFMPFPQRRYRVEVRQTVLFQVVSSLQDIRPRRHGGDFAGVRNVESREPGRRTLIGTAIRVELLA
jgi:hypothetical protein